MTRAAHQPAPSLDNGVIRERLPTDDSHEPSSAAVPPSDPHPSTTGAQSNLIGGTKLSEDELSLVPLMRGHTLANAAKRPLSIVLSR